VSLPDMRALPIALSLIGCLSTTLTAQTLRQRMEQVADGVVHLSFAARPGVCGQGSHTFSVNDDDPEWEQACDYGPVRVALRIQNRQVVSVRTFIGGRWRAGSRAVDLGTVRSQEAVPLLISLAEDGVDGDPLLAATLADSVTVWPSLLRLARNQRLSQETRRSAVFWLAQAAGKAITPMLDSIAADPRGDREVRKHAVFAISQRDDEEAVPALIHIAQSNPDPELRKTALFWLGQTDDPRAISLFEEILR
jgi:hypothetical protein